jgi:hypothetical protein
VAAFNEEFELQLTVNEKRINRQDAKDAKISGRGREKGNLSHGWNTDEKTRLQVFTIFKIPIRV